MAAKWQPSKGLSLFTKKYKRIQIGFSLERSIFGVWRARKSGEMLPRGRQRKRRAREELDRERVSRRDCDTLKEDGNCAVVERSNAIFLFL